MVERIVDARLHDLGGFSVRRVLPSPVRRQVGPFVFLDHMGPHAFAPGEGADVRPHPHIGLSTLTWLYEGEIVHRDSLGVELAIRPGAVNWMTAGRGIVHSERTHPEVRAAGGRVHGLQFWVALPVEAEECDPDFQHVPAAEVPTVALPGARLAVVAGAAFGVTSPVRARAPLFLVDARLDAGARLALGAEAGDRAVYVAEGAVRVGEVEAGPGRLLVLAPGVEAEVVAGPASRVALLGGAPLPEPRFLWWNFVSSRPERLVQAADDWRAERFPVVPGDAVERIPAPEVGPPGRRP